jgi:glutamate--cysteine ligase
MGRLTETAAEQLIASRALAGGPPGFVGAALDLRGPARDRSVEPETGHRETGHRETGHRPTQRALRHGFLLSRSDGTVTLSGPPSPGLESCLARMGDDLATLPGIRPGGGAAAGIRVGLEAGLDGGGPLGLPRRWRLAHTLAPVLAAAFANSPSAGGWRSARAARHRDRPVLPRAASAEPAANVTPIAPATAGQETRIDFDPAGAGPIGLGPCTADLSGIDPRWGRAAGEDPRAAWTAAVLDAKVSGSDRTLRDWLRSDDPPAEADLWRHLDGLRPPVSARGHLELDFVDGQEGDGWRVAVAVIATLLDDPVAAGAAEMATGRFAYEEGVWERASRDALADAGLAAAARECFVAAYAALARRGAPRDLRDAVAAYTDRYVMRGRCPADDRIALGRPRPIEAG